MPVAEVIVALALGAMFFSFFVWGLVDKLTFKRGTVHSMNPPESWWSLISVGSSFLLIGYAFCRVAFITLRSDGAKLWYQGIFTSWSAPLSSITKVTYDPGSRGKNLVFFFEDHAARQLLFLNNTRPTAKKTNGDAWADLIRLEVASARTHANGEIQ